MSDTELSKYFVVGDRVAVKEFCKRKCTPQMQRTGDRKEALLSKLRAKLEARKRSSEHRIESDDESDEDKMHLTSHGRALSGNKNAMKSVRRIEFGWLHRDTLANVKQVRTHNGGGTRIVSTSKSATKMDLIQTAKNLFFTDGICKYGNVREFNFDMCDFKQSIMSDTVTVADLHEQYKMSNGKVRVYLRTTRCASATVSRPAVEEDDAIEDDLTSVVNTTGYNADERCATFTDADTPTVQFRVEKRLVVPPPYHNPPQIANAEQHPSFTDSQVAAEHLSQDEDEDEIVQTAIAASFDDYSTPHESRAHEGEDHILTVTSEETFEELISKLAAEVDVSGLKNVINVNRDDVLDGAFRGFRRPTFDCKKLLNVRFCGEDGIDNGGVTREFLRIAVSAVKTSSIFTGPDDARNILLDYNALEKKSYDISGRLLAYSIVHRGPLPSFLSETLYTTITCGYAAAQPGIQQVDDITLRQQLTAVLAATGEAEYFEMCEPISHLIETAGCLSLMTNFDKRHLLVKNLCHFLVVGRSVVAIDQFKEGLKTLGVLDCMVQHPDSMKRAFVHSSQKLDATIVEGVFVIPPLSEMGSNRCRMEKTTIAFWRDYLQDLEEQDMLSDLLIFATGLDIVPALGFEPKPTLGFRYPDDVRDDATAGYPVANTCANILRLPVLAHYDDFAANMTRAIKTVSTFTLE